MGPKPLQLVSLEKGTVDTDGHRENTMGDVSSAATSQGTAGSWEGGWDLPQLLQRDCGPGDAHIPDLQPPGPEAVSFCCVSRSVILCYGGPSKRTPQNEGRIQQ